MDMNQLERVLKIAFFAAGSIGVGTMLIRFLRLEWMLYRNGKANVETCGAVAYYKDPEVGYLPQGQAGSNIYHITFHTDTGDIVTLSMGYQDYYTIEEGSYGQLTWQGTRFWKFIQT